MKKEIISADAQSAKGLLSQAIEANGFIFTAGFIHMDEEGNMVEGSVEEKFKLVMLNIENVLSAAGSNLDDIVKVTIYVTDLSILAELNKLYVTYFSEPLPAREAIGVKELPLGATIEISVTAIKN